MLSRYRILGKLGTGGMGVVYWAEDIPLHRPVALGFLRGTSLQQEQTRARFLREARTTAALNHPNVCTIHEVGEVESGEEATLGTGERLGPGTPFIAMRVARSRRSSARADRSRFPTCSGSPCRLRMEWRRRTPAGSTTATSCPGTSW